MPATARGLYRPRRNKRKLAGQPKIITRLAPRGLIACCPLATGFAELFGHPVTLTGSPILAPTPFGYGQKTDHGTQCAGYQFPASASPNIFSLEILFYEKSATNDGSLVGWAATAPGTTSSFIAIYSTFPTWSADIFDSTRKTVSGGDSSKTGVLVHLILTNDGAGNLRLYQDGVLKNTTTGITTLFSTSTPFLNIGLGVLGLAVAWNEAEILLVNHASVAWTATEIMARYLNPFGFLTWPEDRRHYLVGVAGAGAQNLSPSLFTNTSTFFSPTVGRGAVNLAPSLFTNTSTFFAPTVSSVYSLTPSLLTNTNTFFSPTVTSTYNLTPSLFTNNSTFFSATVTNAGNLAPSLFTNTNTFFSPTVGRGVVNLAPTLFTNSNIFYSPTVAVAQPQALLPSLYTNPNTFFLPVVRSHIVLLNVHVKLKAPHVFDNTEWPAETLFGPPDGYPVPSDFQYTPLMEGLSGDSISAIAQVYIDIFGRYDAHGNLLDNPPIPRPIYDPQPTPPVGDKHFLPLGNGSWP